MDERLFEEVMREVVELHIDAGADGHAGSILGRGGDVMGGVETVDGSEIGKDKALEAPLLAEDGFEEVWVVGHGNAVDFVVCGHDAHDVTLADGSSEGREHDHAELALAHIYRGSIGACLGRAVGGEVLGFCDDGVVGIEAVALGALYIGEAELCGEIGVFAVGFHDASPARVAGEVDDRREDHIDAGGAGLGRDGGSGLAEESSVPGGGEAEGRGKDGSSIESVQAFFNEESGDAERVVRDDPLLDGVGLPGRGVEVVNGADAEVAPQGLCLLGEKDGALRGVRLVGACAHDGVRSGEHVELADFLLEGHAAEEVVDALFYRGVWLAVNGDRCCRRSRLLGVDGTRGEASEGCEGEEQ